VHTVKDNALKLRMSNTQIANREDKLYKNGQGTEKQTDFQHQKRIHILYTTVFLFIKQRILYVCLLGWTLECLGTF
jgi:hypothetical protein